MNRRKHESIYTKKTMSIVMIVPDISRCPSAQEIYPHRQNHQYLQHFHHALHTLLVLFGGPFENPIQQ